MAVVHFRTTLKAALVNQIKTFIDAGAGAGQIHFYTGAMPATPETAPSTQVLLGVLTFSDPMGTESGGVLTAASITEDSSANAGGTATWARIVDSTGAAVMDVDVTSTTGTGAIKLNTVTIVANGPIRVDSCTITFP